MLPEYLKTMEHLQCVPVIASFSADGEIQPLYTTIKSIPLKIEWSTVLEQNDHSWIPFLCTVIDNGLKKQLNLNYNVQEHAWFAPSEYFR